MSFFSEKVLKRPSAEEVKGYSLRELEIAKKNYNYGHNVCFYTVMVCFIIWAILCSVFRPSVAHASELVGGDEPIETVYDNYLVVYSNVRDSDGKLENCQVLANVRVENDRIYYGYASAVYSSVNLSSVISWLQKEGSLSENTNNYSYTGYDNQFKDLNFYYSTFDFELRGKSFQRTPFLVHKETTVGGLTAPEIAKAIMIQVLGLVPLVLGLAISAIGLRKALAMVYQRLRRA